MKRMLSVGAMLLILGAALVLVLGGCTVTVSGVGPDGYVINAKTGAPIDAASVTLTKIGSTTVYTDTTDTTGYYSFSEYASGQFELTATKTGMAFTKQVVEITGVAQTLPNIGGFTPASSTDLTIIVFWDRGFADLDAYITYPTGTQAAAAVYNTDFYATPTPGTGFAPPDTGLRTQVYFDNMKPSANIFLDVDNQGLSTQQKGGPETVTISGIPWIYTTASNAYAPVTNDPSKLPTGYSYYWVGVCEYYLDAYTSSFTVPNVAEADAMLASTGGVSKTANPSIYVFYDTAQLARYTLPQFTDIKTAAVLRVNTFYRSDDTEWFQILPDTRVYKDAGSIKSLAGNDGIIVAGGKVRR